MYVEVKDMYVCVRHVALPLPAANFRNTKIPYTLPGNMVLSCIKKGCPEKYRIFTSTDNPTKPESPSCTHRCNQPITFSKYPNSFCKQCQRGIKILNKILSIIFNLLFVYEACTK